MNACIKLAGLGTSNEFKNHWSRATEELFTSSRGIKSGVHLTSFLMKEKKQGCFPLCLREEKNLFIFVPV